MAINDYLNNIPVDCWVRGTMNTIAFYKQKINGNALMDKFFYSDIVSLLDVRYNSWYMGKSPNYSGRSVYRTNVMGLEYRPSNAPSKYQNSLFRSAGGLSPAATNLNVYGTPALLHSQYVDLSGKKLVAYMEVVPVSRAQMDYNITNGTFCRTTPIAGSVVSDALEGGNSRVWCSSYSWLPWLNEDFSNYLEDTTIASSLFTVRTLRYFTVDKKTGKRDELIGYSPTFPFVISGQRAATDVPILSSSTPEVLSFSEPKGVGQICLPSGVGAGSNGTIYPFQLATTDGSMFLQGNGGSKAFSSYCYGLLPWYGSFTNISEDVPFPVEKLGNKLAVDTSAAPTLYCPSNIQVVGLFSRTSNAGNQLYIYKDGDRYLNTGGTGLRLIQAASSAKEFIKIFEDWGIYASDNLDEIMYGDIPDIVPESPSGGDSGLDPSLPSDGVGENDPIVGNIPNNPENKIDDFVVESPILTPANLCDSYIYNYSQVRDLFKWFCSVGYIQNQSELFADKLSAIYGLMLFPFDMVSHDSAHVSATDTTTIVSVSENISGYKLETGYNTIINGGSIEYLSYYGNFADWSMCKYSVFIPYGGMIEIPPTAVVNRRLTLQYALDLLTGKATAILKTYSLDDDKLGILVKLIPCQIGHLVPVQSNNFAQREVSNTLSAISMGTTVLGTAAGIAGSLAAGNTFGAISSAVGGVSSLVNQGANMAFSQQLSYCASGGLSPTTGFATPQSAYLSISRAHLVRPSNYRQQNGIPTAYYSQLSAVSTGSNFVRCENIYLDIIRATSAEIDEIRSLLSSGVYI